MEIGRIVRQQRAEQEVRIVRCGSCNAQNVVLDQNNHLHCWYAPREGRRGLKKQVVARSRINQRYGSFERPVDSGSAVCLCVYVCRACRQGFCALCRAMVRKHSLHFGGGKCKQHGR